MRPSRAPVYFPSRAPITVGLFESAALPLRDARESRLPRRGLDEGRRSASGRAGPSGSTWPVAAGSVSAPFACGRIRSPSGLLSHRPPEPSSGSGSRVPPGPQGAEAVFGRVRADVGRWNLVDSHGATYELRRRAGASALPGSSWWPRRPGRTASGSAPEGISPKRAFYVGNVLPALLGYYRVQSGKVRRLPRGRRFSCRRGAGSSDGSSGRTASGFVWGPRPRTDCTPPVVPDHLRPPRRPLRSRAWTRSWCGGHRGRGGGGWKCRGVSRRG